MATRTTESSLDELAKGLATGTLSRGKAIRWMGGALLGAALASFPGVAWADGCRRLGRECRRDSQCCSNNCVRRGDDKVCGCPQGQRRCNDRCVNPKRNENHCGSCSNRCQTDQSCVGGVCCPDAQVCGTGTSLTCCAEGEECDQGVCSGGEPSCIPPSAIPCNGGDVESCVGGVVGGCFCVTEVSSGLAFCSTGGTDFPCTTSCDCPTGQFCGQSGALGDHVCVGTAEMCPP